MDERSRRPALAHHARREVEVVVVEEDRGVGLVLELGQHRVGEALVHRDVALLPRVVEPRIVIGGVHQVPEVVLEEPQRRVRNHVVVPVVRRFVVGDEAQAVGRALARALLDRDALGLRGDRAVLVGHGAGDPGHVVLSQQAPQSRHQPSAPTARHPLSALAPVRDGAAVGDDDQLPPEGHGGSVVPARRELPPRRPALR